MKLVITQVPAALAVDAAQLGLQVRAPDSDKFAQFLATLGYRYWDESQNPVYKLFL